LGNVVDPADTTKKSGAEILRLWCSYVDFGQDVGCGKESFDRVTETYRRFRNTMRFFLGNINDFNPQTDSVAFEKMTLLDQWALGRLNELIADTRAAYEAYEFYKVYHLLNQYFTVTLSAGYLDMLKDRLYTFKKNGVERRSAQTALFTIANSLTRIMAPITSFLSEEVYSYLPGQKLESVFLTDFPEVNPKWAEDSLQSDIDELFAIRSEVTKKLEELRQTKAIGSGLDAKIVIKADSKRAEVLKRHSALLTEFFIVSQVEFNVGAFEISAVHAEGEKCERCWYWSTDVGRDKKYPTVCAKCSTALAD